MVALPDLIHSIAIHVNAPVAALIWVTSIAIPAEPSAATALPALKPNQPTQSIDAPIITIVLLCGGIGDFIKPFLCPRYNAATSAPIPHVAWTTRPPAKSITPIDPRYPPPQTIWHAGRYTKVNHATEKMHIAVNFILSAKAPTTRAGVIIANVIWKVINTDSGSVPDRESRSTPFKNNALRSPMNMPSPLKARL